MICSEGLKVCFYLRQVAGAAADADLSLADVAAEAKHASEVVGTMGVALSVCTLPGQVTSDRLGPKQMELGLGIVSYSHIARFSYAT
jgi:triose/dihydroxyacetone kinase / FAD-AMP lyase (cyclizing)